MKIRIKFEKTGCMKFVGHLDIMRYFQKVMRRADVDIMYSEGFSPHQKMSFAAPLGVGLTSTGEYFDIEVHTTDSSEEMIRRMNETNVDGIKVSSYRLLDDNTKTAMSIVAVADYEVSLANSEAVSEIQKFETFMAQDNITVLKKTKKSEVEVDIKPMIMEYKVNSDSVFMKLMTGSENNLKPELVMEAFYQYIGRELNKFEIQVCRLETYGKDGDRIIPLMDFGTDIS